jgi:anti-sigma factor RsiW
LRVQAYFDGELDAPAAVEVEQHLEQCAGCQALLADLESLRVAIRRDLAPPVPAALRASIAASLDQEEAAQPLRARHARRGACARSGSAPSAASAAAPSPPHCCSRSCHPRATC